MLGKCANRLCSSLRSADEGKLFRLDLDIGNTAGENQRRTAYLWLCDSCARQMIPRIEVAGDTVLVMLGAKSHSAVPGNSLSAVPGKGAGLAFPLLH